MICTLCNSRKARRSCPAAQSAICAQCCGEKREETLDCPLTCEHLIEARKHEHLVPVAPESAPHPEVRLTDEFLNRNDMLSRYVMMCVGVAAAGTPGATDADVREAIDAMVQTLKSSDSGLIYETKPANPFAATIQERVNAQIETLRSQIAAGGAGNALRDKDLLGVLVFMARVAISLNNGRRKGRAFLSMIHSRLPIAAGASELKDAAGAGPAAPPSSLIVTP
jgi:hypothetical protein